MKIPGNHMEVLYQSASHALSTTSAGSFSKKRTQGLKEKYSEMEIFKYVLI